MTRCGRCNAAILTAGRGRRRPPRHCDACRLAIVETADAQADRARRGVFSALDTQCPVCGAPHWGKRRHAVTCSVKCRVYLSRLRQAAGSLWRRLAYQSAGTA